MKTQLLYVKDENCNEEIKQAAEILKNGGLVAIPTETVYGLAASAYNIEAIKNIYVAKGRPSDNPLIVHIAEISELFEMVSEVSSEAKRCMEAFWPGPFTAVLPKTSKIPNEVSGGLDTVAVRMPANKVARAVIKASGLPLAAPSANSSGLPSPTSANHVIKDLSGKIDAIVVSDDCAVGLESTVVTFATNPPRLLRPGGITPEQLLKLVPNLKIDSAVTNQLEKGQKAASPGMKYKHYSPLADVTLAVGRQKEFCDYCNVNKEAFDLAVCFNEEEKNINMPTVLLGGINDYKKQAERLFSVLRELDDKGIKKVIVHAPKTEGMGLAVYNRLIRAAGFKVISL